MSNDTRSASQRIEDLEKALMHLYQTLDNVARDLITTKEAVKLLGNKLDAVVKASVSGQALTDDVISQIMVNNNAQELAEKVTAWVAQGTLVTAEAIDENSFVVGRELDQTDGKVVNPRLQFAASALQPEMRQKFVGRKAGEILTLEEGKLNFEVVEIYSIQAPQAPKTEESPAADTATAEAANS